MAGEFTEDVITTALKKFDLSNNKLTDVPGELGDCTKLKVTSKENEQINDGDNTVGVESGGKPSVRQQTEEDVDAEGDKVSAGLHPVKLSKGWSADMFSMTLSPR